MEQINKDFEEFFNHCQKVANYNEKDMKEILKPLKFLLWKQQLQKYLKILIIVVSICCSIYYFESVNWYFCGVGRIVMIKLLPFWDWRGLEDAKCLVAKTIASKSSESFSDPGTRDCRACQHFDTIDVLEETNYNHIHDNFLVRGLPVIVGDSFVDLNKSETLAEFIDKISFNMIRNEPCNFETNLMMASFASLDEAFKVLTKQLESSSELSPWFISFRNCKLAALKASRLLMPKPYFYPRSLQAPSTSWLLMSQDYDNYENDLNLLGLVIVTQLKGSLKVTFKAKEACHNLCNDLNLDLFSGESLVFLSNLWTFSYEYKAEKNFTVSFITETDFH